jgi:hypothetical protein
MHHHSAYLDEPSRRSGLALQEPIAEFVRRAQDAGAMRGLPPELLLSMLLGAFVGLFKAAEADQIELSPEVLIASEEAAWLMVRA